MTTLIITKATSTTSSSRSPAATATSMSSRSPNLPREVRDMVYEHFDKNSNTVSFRTNIPRGTQVLPSIAYVPLLRSEYLPIHVGARLLDVDLVDRNARDRARDYLLTFAGAVVNNAQQIRISFQDEHGSKSWICGMLILDLGECRSVDRDTSISGNALVGNAHVFFRTTRVGTEHRDVARQFAAAANNILDSHGPDSAPRIDYEEMKQLMRLLADIHGLRLGGLESDWAPDHIGTGAAKEFWASVG